ncbi:MAG: 3-hydroxyacyl-CoA dehydrogenase [Paraglaciecola sp.]|jgi:3-hydroxyacyl-CoA dehydrogenase
MLCATVTLEIKSNIAVIEINNPPVNALSQSVREGLIICMQEAIDNDQVDAIVLACKEKTFIAGADIAEFGKPPQEPHLPDVLAKLYRSPKPVIAALFGTVLGGGFETALSCHFRVALAGTKVGLPEVNLGLIPGAGGTQLLPRVCGVETALELITSGKHTAIENLQPQGAVDKIVDSNLVEQAIEFAKEVVKNNRHLVAVQDREVEADETTAALFQSFRAKLAKRAKGQIAPQLAIDSIENTLTLSFDEGMKKEREYFFICRDSAQSAALKYAFFAEKSAAKISTHQGTATPNPIEKIAVIGAGTMGGGIAMCFANAGFGVILVETSTENLERGLTAIQTRYEDMVSKKRLKPSQRDTRVALIKGTCEYQDLANSDLIIEAAFESMAVKKDIFTALDKVCKPQAILATNTSYLDVNEIAASTSRPEKVVGMHFFSPANIMKLLEVVKAQKTDADTLAAVMSLGKRIGKISVLVGMCYGFVGNRMYSCYGREANMLLIEGATPQQIDKAMVEWGMAMGPLAVNDMSGIDIAYKARHANTHLPRDPLYFKAADLMVESGRLGQKTQAGFYRYDASGKKFSDDEAIEMFAQEATKQAITRRNIDDSEIQNRLILALINEGATILEEGIANKASDIDVIWLNGYGFPRYKGGPMFYADTVGLDTIVVQLETLHKDSGKSWWKPAKLLVDLANSRKNFSGLKD